jgi:hypothetical protein
VVIRNTFRNECGQAQAASSNSPSESGRSSVSTRTLSCENPTSSSTTSGRKAPLRQRHPAPHQPDDPRLVQTHPDHVPDGELVRANKRDPGVEDGAVEIEGDCGAGNAEKKAARTVDRRNALGSS